MLTPVLSVFYMTAHKVAMKKFVPLISTQLGNPKDSVMKR